MRKALWAALAGGIFALGSSGAMAAPVDCGSIHTMGAWETAGACAQGDKLWTWNSDTLDATAGVSFTFIGDTYAMQITGFDLSAAAGAWNVNYTITVTNAAFRITDMFAGADNPGGGSLLKKDVSGDATFTLKVVDGAEDAASEKHGLTATTLTVDENFSVGAGKTLLSVSDTFTQTRQHQTPVPGTLALLGLGLVALGAVRRKKSS